MKIRKIATAWLVLCLFIVCTFTVNAQTAEEEYTEVERDFVNRACQMEYELNERVYKITSSGRAALERKMTTVDLSEGEAETLLGSTVTDDNLSEQLAKGYVEMIRKVSNSDGGSSDGGSSDEDDEIGNGSSSGKGTTEDSVGVTTTQKNNVTEKNSTSSGQNRTGKDIWSAVIDDSDEKENSTTKQSQSSDNSKKSSSETTGEEEAEEESEESESTTEKKKTSGSTSKEDEEDKSQDTEDTTTNLTSVSKVLQSLEEEKKEENQNTVLSKYNMPSQKNAKAQILCETDSESVQILDQDGNVILSYSDADITSQEIEGNVIHIEWLIPLVLVMFFITILCIYIAYRQKFFAEENKNGIKKLIRVVLMLLLTANLLIILAGASLFSGLLRTSNVVEALNRSSYYEHAYAEMAENAVRILKENSADSDILLETLTYPDFVLKMKQSTENQLSHSRYELDFSQEQDLVQEQLNDYYTRQEEEELEETGEEETKEETKERKVKRKEKVTVITNSIISNYKKYVDFYPCHIIKQVRRDVKAVFQLVFPAAIVGVVANIIGLAFLHRRRKESVVYAGVSALAAGLLGVLGIVSIYVKKPYAEIYLSPEYLYQFFLTYADNAVKIIVIISGLLAVLGLAVTLVGIKVTRKK